MFQSTSVVKNSTLNQLLLLIKKLYVADCSTLSLDEDESLSNELADTVSQAEGEISYTQNLILLAVKKLYCLALRWLFNGTAVVASFVRANIAVVLSPTKTENQLHPGFSSLPLYTQSCKSNETWISMVTTITEPDGTKTQRTQIICRR
ncbi:MAG: hypothetical protein F6K31_13725 [Symploca sp. SIO2G7]|nr:hypothetical protein [Symploca sp. SIO2G7]